MKLMSQSFEEEAAIPGEFAVAATSAHMHISLSSHRNPHLKWTEVPAETRSLVLIYREPRPSVPGRVRYELNDYTGWLRSTRRPANT